MNLTTQLPPKVRGMDVWNYTSTHVQGMVFNNRDCFTVYLKLINSYMDGRSVSYTSSIINRNGNMHSNVE
jgi:hypothetical protein